MSAGKKSVASKGLIGVLIVASLVTVISGGMALQQYYGGNQSLLPDEVTDQSTSDSINAALVAAADEPTFKLFAPAWRQLGGDANKGNVKYFKEIFTNMNPATIPGKAEGTKVYKYTLGPYVTAPYVPCDLMPAEIPADTKANCGKAGKVLPAATIGRQLANPSLATYAVDFTNNFLLIPDSTATLSYVKAEAGEKIKFNGSSTNLYDGILSDSMGIAPLGAGYLKSPVLKPGSSPAATYSKAEWLAGQSRMLAAKKEGLPSGKALIFNGLADGATYFQSDSTRSLITDSIYGVMAERIFRDPKNALGSWESADAWKKDVDMIVDVQNKGKRGYWWSKCWSRAGSLDRDTCLDDTGGDGARTQLRRYLVASYLMGAGDKSYFNYDVDKCDGGYSTSGSRETDDEGTEDDERTKKTCPGSNAAEWYETEYKKAMAVGSASGGYRSEDGYYTRSFTNGVVIINPTGDAKTVDIGSGRYTDFDNNEVTGTYRLGDHSGVVLVSKTGTGGGSTDTEKPTVSIASPAAGANVSGTVAVNGTASDNKAVQRVDLIVDGEVVATDSSEPWYSIPWDTTTVANGDHSLKLVAYDTSGNSKSTDALTVKVANASGTDDIRIVSFDAAPKVLSAGAKSKLSWKTVGAKSCSLTPGGPTNTTETSWVTGVLTAGSKEFTLTCVSASGKSVKRSVTVSVTVAGGAPSKPVLSTSALSVKRGGSITASWYSKNANSCTLTPGNYSAKGESGSKVISDITKNIDVSVTCKNEKGTTKSDTVTIRVSTTTTRPELEIVSFTSSSEKVDSGSRATLSWSVRGARANGCAIQPSLLSSVATTGSWITPKLTAPITYRLTCVSNSGKVATKTLTIGVADLLIAVEPRPKQPSVLATVASSTVFDTSTNERIANASAEGSVSGKISFDPGNVIDNDRSSNVTYVEYLNDEGEVVQKVATRPYALDSTKLANGVYAMTERTVFGDGSESEVARIINVNNSGTSVDWWKNTWTWLLVSLPIAVITGIFYLLSTRSKPGDDDYVALEN